MDVDEFESYVRKYPNGVFREIAKLRIDGIHAQTEHANAQEPSPPAGINGLLQAPPTALPTNDHPFDGYWEVTPVYSTCKGRPKKIFLEILNGRIETDTGLKGKVSKSGDIRYEAQTRNRRRQLLSGRLKGNSGYVRNSRGCTRRVTRMAN